MTRFQRKQRNDEGKWKNVNTKQINKNYFHLAPSNTGDFRFKTDIGIYVSFEIVLYMSVSVCVRESVTNIPEEKEKMKQL